MGMPRYHKLDEAVSKKILEDRKNHVNNPYKALDEKAIRRDMEKGDAIQRCLTIERHLSPDRNAAEQYRKLFTEYREIHDALAPVYAR